MDIYINDVVKTFNEHYIFNHFSYGFQENAITAVTGASGRGKTTLLRMIAGLDTDYQGSITNVPQNLSYLFQEDALLPWKNVYNNIEFVIKDILSESDAEKVINKVLKDAMLEEHQHKYPAELSGGMQRRVALCRSFVYPAHLLLMDEPFSGLDSEMKNTVADNFLSLVRGRTTAIIVSHDHAIIEKCDVVLDLES